MVSEPASQEAIRILSRGLYAEHLKKLGILAFNGKSINGRMEKVVCGARQNLIQKGQVVTSNSLLNEVLRLTYFRTYSLSGIDPRFSYLRTPELEPGVGRVKVTYPMVDNRPEGHGAPLGGLGAGAIVRDPRGNFHDWTLRIGRWTEDVVWPTQFHVRMQQEGGSEVIARTLSNDSPIKASEQCSWEGGPDMGLKTWGWQLPEKGVYYQAQYPYSGYDYSESPEFPAHIAIKQFSPVIPGNYQETSYPVAVFVVRANNPTDKPIKVSVMLTAQNMIGWQTVEDSKNDDKITWDRNSIGDYNTACQNKTDDGHDYVGVVFKRRAVDKDADADPRDPSNDMYGQMAVLAQAGDGVSVSYKADFDPYGDGGSLWNDWAADGSLPNEDPPKVAGQREGTAGAIAVSFTLQPGQTIETPVVMSWDFPYTDFGTKTRNRQQKFYTRYFGREGTYAEQIARTALDKWKDWQAQIDESQRPIINDPKLPDWAKVALLNTTYNLAITGHWEAYSGRFTYLEGVSYEMFGTTDVNFYPQAIPCLWPALERSELIFLAQNTASPVGWNPTVEWSPYDRWVGVPEVWKPYYYGPNTTPNAVVHDYGTPKFDNAPQVWRTNNRFVGDWQNPNLWVDLPSKFVLRAGYYNEMYKAAMGRDDADFIQQVYPGVRAALDRLEAIAGDPETHVPRSRGIPDQTYDTWSIHGAGSNITSSWLAALVVARSMASFMAQEAKAEKNLGLAKQYKADDARYKDWYKAGQPVMDYLWNEKGGYYNISMNSKDITSDQLLGDETIRRMLGTKAGVVPLEKAVQASLSLAQFNMHQFGNGYIGVVNGRTESGQPLNTEQGDEVWTGVNNRLSAYWYFLGASTGNEELKQNAWEALYGFYNAVYTPVGVGDGQGYAFFIPEGYINPEEPDFDKSFSGKPYGKREMRSPIYMRPDVWNFYLSLLAASPDKGAVVTPRSYFNQMNLSESSQSWLDLSRSRKNIPPISAPLK